MEYMPHIHVVIFGLVAFLPEWRKTCFIIFLAALANILYTPLTAATSQVGNYNVPAVYAFTDFIVIMALLLWGRKGNLLQASVLALAISTNLALLLDYKFPPYPVYEVYPQVIFTLNIIQLFLISGGIYAVVRRARDTINNFLGGIRHGRHRGGIVGYRSGHHRNSSQ